MIDWRARLDGGDSGDLSFTDLAECVEAMEAEIDAGPRWLDAPDRPGLWYFKLSDGFSDTIRIAAVPVPDTYLPCRWFGPIPEDVK